MPRDVIEEIFKKLDKLEKRIDESARIGVPALYHATLTTTGAGASTIYTFSTATGYTYQLLMRVVARRTGGAAGSAGDSGSYMRHVMFKNVSGTVTVSDSDIGTDYENQAGWDVSFTTSGTNVLAQVTGAADNTINWDMQATITQVT